MSNKKPYTSKEFLKITLSNADAISESSQSVKDYAHEEGIDIDQVMSEGKKRMKRLMLKLKAEETRSEMISNQTLKEMALEIVDRLMEEVNFSFPTYVQEHGIPVHNRNLEKLSDEDIKNTLIQYHYLKLIEKNKKDS